MNSKLIYGVGINDVSTPTGYQNQKGKQTQYKWYTHWKAMLQRCYVCEKRSSNYKDCYVCEEWKLASNFKHFHDRHYKHNYTLDKDFKFAKNKVYSPETCIFIPSYLNTALTLRGNFRGELPLGVNIMKSKNCTKYVARLCTGGGRIYLGVRSTREEAYTLYRDAKLKYLDELIDTITGDISSEDIGRMKCSIREIIPVNSL